MLFHHVIVVEKVFCKQTPTLDDMMSTVDTNRRLLLPVSTGNAGRSML
jgi:hypothetical protein